MKLTTALMAVRPGGAPRAEGAHTGIEATPGGGVQ
jgi:hypothetical protein